MNKILKIYEILYKKFGPQNWWPTTREGKDAPEYSRKVKLNEKEKWEIAVGAILTQNTAWGNVEKAITNLNRAGFFKDVFNFNLSELEKLIRPSGFFRQKSRYLKSFIDHIASTHRGSISRLLNQSASPLRKELLSLKGIGPETADSILLYAASKPSFVVDAYTVRIANRIGLTDSKKYSIWKTMFESVLPKNAEVYGEYHALLVKLGKNICRKNNPLCFECALIKICFEGRVRYGYVKGAKRRRGDEVASRSDRKKFKRKND